MPTSWAVGVWRRPHKVAYALGPFRAIRYITLKPWRSYNGPETPHDEATIAKLLDDYWWLHGSSLALLALLEHTGPHNTLIEVCADSIRRRLLEGEEGDLPVMMQRAKK